jgi:hypothetical protein
VQPIAAAAKNVRMNEAPGNRERMDW